MIEIYPLYAGKTLADFSAGNFHIRRLLVRLADIVGELFHALVKAAEILAQLA